MSYLICDNCEGYYELQDGESPSDFDTCECGGSLKSYSSLDDYNNENDEPERESMAIGKGYAEIKSSKYNMMVIAGAVLGLLGFIGLLVSFYL